MSADSQFSTDLISLFSLVFLGRSSSGHENVVDVDPNFWCQTLCLSACNTSKDTMCLLPSTAALNSWSFFFTIVSAYVLLVNLLFWYKFVSAWNMITRTHSHREFEWARMCRRQRPKLPTFQAALQSLHYLLRWLASLSNASLSSISSIFSLTSSSTSARSNPFFISLDSINAACPICLVDFTEQESVTACDDKKDGGCCTWFHNDCLFEWLNRYSDSCPCCRKSLVTIPATPAAPLSPMPLRPSQSHEWLSDLSDFMGY